MVFYGIWQTRHMPCHFWRSHGQQCVTPCYFSADLCIL